MLILRKTGSGSIECPEEAWESHREALLKEGWKLDGADPLAVPEDEPEGSPAETKKGKK